MIILSTLFESYLKNYHEELGKNLDTNAFYFIN